MHVSENEKKNAQKKKECNIKKKTQTYDSTYNNEPEKTITDGKKKSVNKLLWANE